MKTMYLRDGKAVTNEAIKRMSHAISILQPLTKHKDASVKEAAEEAIFSLAKRSTRPIDPRIGRSRNV